jgi:glycosyltransferase involved in cell wall biosynthesis
LRVFTWHIHGNYLWYLSHVPVDWYLPVGWAREGYGGRSPSFPWPDNVHEIDVHNVADEDFDCIVFQSHPNWWADQHDILSADQRRLPRIFLEHDPPREHPTDTRHPVDDDDVVIVHVTHFNDLMWNNRSNPTVVIEHGVTVPDDVAATYQLDRGIVVVNSMNRRGRRVGADVYRRVREHIPLDLVGMESMLAGGLGEVPNTALAAFIADYRFFFNPIRYTSLGLAILEAMQIGLPIVGLATTELVTVIENGVHGFVETDIDALVGRMRVLLSDRDFARELGSNARKLALTRFSIERFVDDWTRTLQAVVGRDLTSPSPV